MLGNDGKTSGALMTIYTTQPKPFMTLQNLANHRGRYTNPSNRVGARQPMRPQSHATLHAAAREPLDTAVYRQPESWCDDGCVPDAGEGDGEYSHATAPQALSQAKRDGFSKASR